MKKYKNYLLIILGTLFCSGCEDFVTVDVPPVQLSSANTFSDEASADAAVTGIYASMATGFLSANMQFAMEYFSGDLVYNSTTDTYVQFMNRNIHNDNSLVASFWSGLYQYIYYCNSAIEGLEKSKLEAGVKNRLRGECLFLRAFCYSFLVKCWGGVPLVLSTDWQVNQSLPRASADEIYQQVTADLEESKHLLKESPASINTRAGYYSAAALLSRISLYMEDWEKAAENATIVIGNPAFQMEDLNNVFLISGKEALFSLSSIDPSFMNTNIGQQLVPWSASSVPAVGVSASLLALFNGDDRRKLNWIKVNTVKNVAYSFPFKYKEGIFSSQKKENLVVLRLAEQYLIRAFARIKLGDNDRALSDLNAVRSRASVPYSEVSTEAVMTEARLEFFGEWGTGSFGQPAASLWPIPLTQLNSNPFLTQNKGS